MTMRALRTRSANARLASARRAATVLELMVVVFIIGIAMAMLLPSLKRSLQLARDAVCQQNLREVGHSLTLYRVENDGWLPSGKIQNAGSELPAGEEPVWFVQLYPMYLTDPTALSCPRDPYRYRMMRARSHLTDPAVSEYSSYGMNGLLSYGAHGRLADLDRAMPTRPLDTILVADLGPDDGPFDDTSIPRQEEAPSAPDPKGKGIGVSTGGSTKSRSYLSGGPARNHGRLSWDDGFDPLTLDKPEPWLTARHGKGVNILTLAGGVRKAGTKHVMESPVRRYYRDCAAGGCSLCNSSPQNQVYHYSFARDRLYWWTGPVRAD